MNKTTTIEAQPWAMAQMAEQYGWVYRCIGNGNPTQGTHLYEFEPDPDKEGYDLSDLSEDYLEDDLEEDWDEDPEELPKEAVLGLCEGRHPLPVDGYIYGNTLDPTDLLVLREKATKALRDIQELTLYVTGLTVALVEVINVCHRLGINVTLMHFDRDSGEYFPQVVE